MIRYINLVLFAGMIVMNYLANAIPINNRTTGELSDAYPNLFVPAGLTFSIWGLIYLLLLVYCIVQFSTSNQIAVSGTAWLFAMTCVFNSTWILAWHYQKLPLSLFIMLCLLVTLILINIFLSKMPVGLIKAAFGIYLGWICIATIANVTALLVNYKWDGYGISDDTWTIIMIAAGAVIASLSIINFRNPFIGLSVVWAFTGIIIKRQEDFKSIVIAASVAIFIVAAVTIMGFARRVSP